MTVSSEPVVRRPRRKRGAALLVGGAALLGACDRESAPPVPRHVLVISLDTTRADHLGCYGSGASKTPALDALAARGARFADCTAAAATTLASHTSLFTGTYPRKHGVPRNGFVLDEANVTLAERLAAAGFWCAGFLGSFALDARFGFAQGFDHFDQVFDVPVGVGGGDQDQRTAARVTDAVLGHVDILRARGGFEPDGRLFLFAHYFDPHAPYLPPSLRHALATAPGGPTEGGTMPRIGAAIEAHQRAALGVASGASSELSFGAAGVVARGLPRALAEAPPAEASAEDLALAALYAAEVTYMDGEIGRLLLGLEARGLLCDTLIVVTADHGETFWEHPNYWNHGLWVHQTDVHVPLLVCDPRGLGAGRVSEDVVSNVDVLPTILDLLGLAPEPRAQGRSLTPALHGERLAQRPVYTEATQPGALVEPEDAGRGGPWWNDAKPRAVRLGRWKLVRAPYVGLERLFDLTADPAERVDLLATAPLDAGRASALNDERAAALPRLRRALDDYEASPPALPSHFDPVQSVDTVRRLQALGYVESGR